MQILTGSNQQRIVPKFQVKKRNGTYKSLVFAPVEIKLKNGKTRTELQAKVVKRDCGFMVFCPDGKATHVTTEEELIRMGFAAKPKLVDRESGEEKEDDGVVDLERVARLKAGFVAETDDFHFDAGEKE